MQKHIFNKHGEKVEEVKKEVRFFNMYLKVSSCSICNTDVTLMSVFLTQFWYKTTNISKNYNVLSSGGLMGVWGDVPPGKPRGRPPLEN